MMSRDDSREKKLIRAPADLVAKLNEAANREGKTFYSYVSEVLEQAVRAYEMGRSLKEIIDVYEILEVHRDAGTTAAPRDVLDYLIKTAYGKNSENLEKLWYQSGRWYGVYFKERFKESVDGFIRLLRDGRLGIDQVTMRNDDGMIELRCVSAFLSQERTLLMGNFIEGAMHSLGYKTKEREFFRGIIRLTFYSEHSSSSKQS